MDADNFIKDTELLIEIAFVLPSIAAGSVDKSTAGSVNGEVWMMEIGAEGILHDGSWYRFEFLLDGRKRRLSVGDVIAPFDVGDRLVIVLNDDWEPQIFRDSELDVAPVSEDILRALRREWD